MGLANLKILIYEFIKYNITYKIFLNSLNYLKNENYKEYIKIDPIVSWYYSAKTDYFINLYF